MVKKTYDWEGGAILEEHSKMKLAILREYFRQYLIIRCQLPNQELFRLAVIDGFSGGGLYKCGSYGSPLIFVDVLINTVNEINLSRANQGIRAINIHCLIILNDLSKEAIAQLKKNIAPLLVLAEDTCKNLRLELNYLCGSFEDSYPLVKKKLLDTRCKNVFFNLDQCGYSWVSLKNIKDILNSWPSAEVLLTFMIKSLLAYISPDSDKSGVPLEPKLRKKIDSMLENGDEFFSKTEWLGEVEKIVFDTLKDCATYVSPFSINNPKGWRYWLIHFAKRYRARQVFNNILHHDGRSQAHFGRSGLYMLSYDPQFEG